MATKKNLLKSPLFIALIIVFCFCFLVSIFTFVSNDSGEQKNITELTGNVSGVRLDIRTLPSEKLEEIINTKEKVYKLQIIQDCIFNFNGTYNRT